MPKTIKLTLKQQKFIAAYVGEAKGNATQAAKLAGYKGNMDTLRQVGAENFAKPYIKREIEKLVEESPLIAGKEERLKFYTDMLRNDTIDWRVRLDAAKTLGQVAGDFVQRTENKTDLNVNKSPQEMTEDELRWIASQGFKEKN